MRKRKQPSTYAHVRALRDLRRRAAKSSASEGSRINPARWDDAVDAAIRAIKQHDRLLWLIRRARAIRTANGWTPAERALSWRDWDMHASVALGEIEGATHD